MKIIDVDLFIGHYHHRHSNSPHHTRIPLYRRRGLVWLGLLLDKLCFSAVLGPYLHLLQSQMGLPSGSFNLRARLTDMRQLTQFYGFDCWSCHRGPRVRRDLFGQFHHHCVLCTSRQTSTIWSLPGQHVWHCFDMRTAAWRRFHRPPDMAMVLLHQPPAWRGCNLRIHGLL